MAKAGTNAGMGWCRTRLGNAPFNSNAFIGQAGTSGASRSCILRLCVTSNVSNAEVISIGEVTATAFSCSASSVVRPVSNLGAPQSMIFRRARTSVASVCSSARSTGSVFFATRQYRAYSFVCRGIHLNFSCISFLIVGLLQQSISVTLHQVT